MATRVIKDGGILFGGFRVSAVANSCRVGMEAEEQDATVFEGSQGHRDRVGGLRTADAAFSGLVDYARPIDAGLFDGVGLEGAPFTATVGALAVGAVAYFMRASVVEYSPGGEVGELHGFEGSAVSFGGPLVRGVVLDMGEDLSAARVGAAYNAGGFLAGKAAYGNVHVFKINPGATVRVIVESAAAADFVGATTRADFQGIAAPAGMTFGPIPGPVTDAFWRARITPGGASPLVSALVAMGLF